MEKTIYNNLNHYIFYFYIFVLLGSSFPLLADHECDCPYCEIGDITEEHFDYESLGELEVVFRNIEEAIDADNRELEIEVECGVFKKWGKKIKRWMKRKVYNLFKKCVNLDKLRTMDDCAYTFANFKRKLDKIYKTGSIDKLLDKFDEQLPKDPRISDFREFKSKVKYYANNKHAKPSDKNCLSFFSLDCQKPEYNGELDDIPTRALIGGVMVGCGTLIGFIPFPGCAYVGSTIATTGFGMIVDAYVKKWEEEEKNNPAHGMVQSF